ncbi:MAG: alanine--tRNA ligase [Planctomycetaceae bacterium]|nr:alanine--tRNA ligase [Planctomycetaceae bacterium]
MKTNELREKYLSFFESKGCVRRPSDVLIPKNDDTVLFTPAGMNQFKNQFLGIGKLEFSRATTCQKCLRTGDIGNVGVTAYHHTFFEMLGNFSFGDYFKREAIHWAWEFLTQKEWLGLDADRLTVTVYLDDDEAYNIWHDEIKLSADRIRRDNEHENFWPAGAPSDGPDGVCGPCSEIFYNPDSGKEVEIWNLVFTQFNRVGDPPDNLRPLPKKNIDTGMGLERTAAVLQGFESNFEIDILKPLCLAAADIVGVKYDFDAPQGRPLRRIADHVRAITFCIHEGVMPDSEKENYIVRQLLRRASLEGFLLGRTDPFLHELVPAIVDVMKAAYPEIADTVESVQQTIQEEESQFLDVVDRGLSRFNKCVESAKSSGSNMVSAKDAFNLHTQDGFLIELTEAMAARNELTVDLPGFKVLIDKHKEISNKGGFEGVMAAGPIDILRNDHGDTEFLGYFDDAADGQIVGITKDGELAESVDASSGTVGLVLNQTPFYGEAGGQVGDTGTIAGDGFEFNVADTKKDGQMIIHLGHATSGSAGVGTAIKTSINLTKRAGLRRAHSATHILHHALHETIGGKATQRGSKVEDDALRFDFSHKQALTREELNQVEDIINQRIADGADVATELMDLESAKSAGAMALFGEKYPDRVRVVQMADFSTELCGGTHVSNTGQIGFCKIMTDEPVQKGVRRITALTGPKALEKIRETENLLKELVVLLKTPQPEDLPRRVAALQDELRDAKRDLAKRSTESIAGQIDDLIANAEEVDGVKIITFLAENQTRESLRDFMDQLRAKTDSAAILVGASIEGKVALTAAVTKSLVGRGMNASDCIRAAAKLVGGGGGGRPDMAEAGGKNPDKLPEALTAAADCYRQQIGG